MTSLFARIISIRDKKTSMSFLAELKRRNVVRVGVAYVVTAWLLLQVADLNLVEYWRTYGWADACHPLGEDDFECL
jgi:hypothetical protein